MTLKGFITGPWGDGQAFYLLEPSVKDGMVGYRAVPCDPDGSESGPEQFIYFNPSTSGDSADVFVYQGEEFDPGHDTPLTHVSFE